MPRISTWGKLAAFGLVCYLAAAVFVGADARAQKDDKDKAEKQDDKPGELKKAYVGIAGCRLGVADLGCHNRPLDKPLPAGKRDLVCRSYEIKFWLEKDKHASAYKVLITEPEDAKVFVEKEKDRYEAEEWDQRVKDKKTETAEDILKKNARAKQMVAILRKAKNNPKYKLTTDPDCLACHAQVVSDADRKAKLVDEKTFNVEEGVNCVVCHGPYQTWVTEHYADSNNKFKKWREKDRVKKEKDYGMTDLWNPVSRTKMCASCHVGNQGDKGEHPRFVTHEMYAAGHPPLPSFEVAAFSNEMPRHWDYLRDKNDDILKFQKIDKKNFEYEQAQLVLIGAATALAESMRLIAHQSGLASKTEDKTLDWSNYDCYACHHGLEKDAWRQQRGYGKNRPGRLPMRPWAAELVKLAIAYVSPDEAAAKKQQETFEKKLDAVKEAFTARMYGDPAKIAAAATDLQKWANALADSVAAKLPTKKEDAVRAYQMIPKVYDAKDPKQWIDFDSARQVGWGFKGIYFDVKRYPWFDEEAKKDDKNPKKDDPVIAQLSDLGKMLKLNLPRAPKTVEDDMEVTMDAVNKYRPAEFNKKLEALGKSLPKE